MISRPPSSSSLPRRPPDVEQLRPASATRDGLRAAADGTPDERNGLRASAADAAPAALEQPQLLHRHAGGPGGLGRAGTAVDRLQGDGE